MKILEKDNFNFQIRFNVIDELIDEGDIVEPDAFISKISGIIEASNYCNKSNEVLPPQKVGYLEAYLIDAERLSIGNTTVLEACDCHGTDLGGIAETFYEDDCLLTDSSSIVDSESAIVLNYLEIDHDYRGLGVGNLAIESFIRHFGGMASAILLQAVPQQIKILDKFERPPSDKSTLEERILSASKGTMRYDLLEPDWDKAKNKLSKAWENLSFKKYRDDERGWYMFRLI